MESDGAARLLLDTHIWIWLMNGEPHRLGAATVEAIERAATTGRVYVSAISVWEVAMLDSKGRIRLSRDCGEWVREALSAPGVQLLPLSPDIAVASSRLPGTFHGDPADRILAASARLMTLTLVTRDERILAYAAAHYVTVLEPHPLRPQGLRP
jgi:PIN domain nuclease of toxin-antitoxin system